MRRFAVELAFDLALGAGGVALLALGDGASPALTALPFNALLAALAAALLRCAFSRRASAALALAGAAGLSWLNHRKIEFLHEPILLSDVFKARFAPFVAQFLGAREYAALAALVLAPLLAFALGARSERRFLPFFALLGVSCLVFRDVHGNFPAAWLRERAFLPGRLDAEASAANGYLLNLVLNAEVFRPRAPAGYSPDQVRDDLRAFAPTPEKAGEARDVVVVLLESHYDLTARASLHFVADYLPFWHALRGESRALPTFTPKSGGGTANAEYEVLTGLASHLLPDGGVPYEQYVRRRVPSLAWHFARRGYTTLALHPWSGKAWNREGAYPFLGFQRFLSASSFPGASATDETIFRKSLALLRAPGRAPQFQFLATADTHAPYVKRAGMPAWLEEPRGDHALADQVDAYATLMNVLDARLKEYFRGLRALPRPPLVLLFGDHQPEFTGALFPAQSDRLALFRNEALLWGAGKGVASAARDLYCLAPEVLAGSGDAYFRYLADFCARRGSLWSLDPALTEGAAERARMDRLAYDRLFGEAASEF